MARTIQALAAGAAMICLALPPQRAEAGDGDVVALSDGREPAPLVEPRAAADVAPAADDVPAFVWSSDLSLTPLPYSTPAKNPYLPPPSAAAPAIPLPPAAWTGFASLAGLGTIALLRRFRRSR